MIKPSVTIPLDLARVRVLDDVHDVEIHAHAADVYVVAHRNGVGPEVYAISTMGAYGPNEEPYGIVMHIQRGGKP